MLRTQSKIQISASYDDYYTTQCKAVIYQADNANFILISHIIDKNRFLKIMPISLTFHALNFTKYLQNDNELTT